MNGRALFAYNKDLFVTEYDKEPDAPTKKAEIKEENKEGDEEQITEKKEAVEVD